MSSIAADTLYEISYRSSWGAGVGPIGHVVIRRLDDHEVIAEIAAANEDEARELIAQAEHEIRGSAEAFEASWSIGAESAADPGPDVRPPLANAESIRERREGEQISTTDPRISVLPDPAAVFPADQRWLARVLHPLVSIELSAFDPSWGGRVHLLSPVEPEAGLLGTSTAAHHNDFVGENWISFRVEPDGRYRFLGQRSFFEIEAFEQAGGAVPASLREVYADAAAEFAGTKSRWERLGALVWGDEEDPTQQREGWGTDIALLDELEGEPGYGNWASFPPPPACALDEEDPGTPLLRLKDGRPFTYVGSTAGYPWRSQGADAILLFFEPETRTAVLTFDWS